MKMLKFTITFVDLVHGLNLKSEEKERTEKRWVLPGVLSVVSFSHFFFNFVDETTGSKIVGVLKVNCDLNEIQLDTNTYSMDTYSI